MTIGICFGRNVCGSHCLQLKAPIYTIYQTVQICWDKLYRSRSDEKQLNKPLYFLTLWNKSLQWKKHWFWWEWIYCISILTYFYIAKYEHFLTPKLFKSTLYWYLTDAIYFLRVKENIYVQLSGIGGNISRYLFKFTSGTVDHRPVADAWLWTLSVWRTLSSVTIPPIVVNAWETETSEI